MGERTTRQADEAVSFSDCLARLAEIAYHRKINDAIKWRDSALLIKVLNDERERLSSAPPDSMMQQIEKEEIDENQKVWINTDNQPPAREF